MKKHFLWFWLLLVTLQINAQTVYITKTGEKYHEGSCRYLSQSKIAIELKDALTMGYTACKVCRPTQDITGNTKELKQDEKQDPGTTNTPGSQCTATTQKGERCKRMTTSANGKCKQHGG